jgi:hypothetical protein
MEQVWRRILCFHPFQLFHQLQVKLRAALSGTVETVQTVVTNFLMGLGLLS